ncbi:MAG TPA: glutaredoxin domain-containing protein, partial [Hyphomicrobium sp.]|nr:glutaredoxin domain-containing protein [Hyphomicrobium sp.]
MSEAAAHEAIKKTIEDNDVVLFMKGTAQFPQCGFSAQIAQILLHLGVPFQDVNVLEDQDLREGIKTYTN